MKFVALSLLSLFGSSAAFAPASSLSRPTALEASRKPFISGNWKLNPQTKDEAVKLAADIAKSVGPDTPESDIALFVPYVFIEAAMKSVDGKLHIGAEVSFSHHF
jgi:triosephosphate isomerase